MNYDVVVMAVNKKGKSSPVMIQGYTVKSPEKQTGNRCERFFSLVTLTSNSSSFLSYLSLFRLLAFPYSDIPAN